MRWTRLVGFVSVIGGVLLALGLSGGGSTAQQPVRPTALPISLHPVNPHYFLFRGRPELLIASAEHYGALINLEVDYVRYLDELRRLGFNVTRVFSGSYVEPEDANPLGYQNTLAPRPGRYLAPWARSETPGYPLGGTKFDLTRWNGAYFERLKDLVRAAGRRGVVVELTLFSAYYSEAIWRLSPLHVSNNVNGVGDRTYQRVYEMEGNEAILRVQEALVRKLVSELRGFDNVFFEVFNEPWAGPCNPSAAECSMRRWQDRMISLIWKTERGLPSRHLIAEDVGHGVNAHHGAFNLTLRRPNPRVSVYEYHYAPALAARSNYGLDKAIGNNETGAEGTGERKYRTECWEFLLAGGSVCNNLDWSFTTDREDGSSEEFRTAFVVLGDRASSGGRELQRQLSFLRRFVMGFDVLRMRPDPAFVAAGLPDGIRASVLSRAGRAYALYVPRGPLAVLVVRLPRGAYRLTWLDPVTGQALERRLISHTGGTRRLAAPAFDQDLALSIRRRS